MKRVLIIDAKKSFYNCVCDFVDQKMNGVLELDWASTKEEAIEKINLCNYEYILSEFLNGDIKDLQEVIEASKKSHSEHFFLVTSRSAPIDPEELGVDLMRKPLGKRKLEYILSA